MLVYVHSIRIYVHIYICGFIRRKQLPATAWYAVMSYGAESACSRDLLRSIITFTYRVSLAHEESCILPKVWKLENVECQDHGWTRDLPQWSRTHDKRHCVYYLRYKLYLRRSLAAYTAIFRKKGVLQYLRWMLFMERNVSFCRARAI